VRVCLDWAFLFLGWFMIVNIADLKVSEFSQSIYSHEPTQDLIDSIQANGVLVSIWIDKDNKIISGHRRVNACKKLGVETIEAEIKEYSDLYVIEANRYRQKGIQEIYNETRALKKIESEKAKERQTTSTGGSDPQLVENFPQAEKGKTRDKVAEKVGISGKQLEKIEAIVENKPELIEDIDLGKESINSAHRKVKKQKVEEQRKEYAKQSVNYVESESIEILNCDFRDACIANESIDCILTDPPYPKEYLNLWNDLGVFASKALKPGGWLIAYSGQFYLPEIYKMLSENLSYFWTFAILHQNSHLVHARKIFNRFKPILIYYKEPLRLRMENLEDLLTKTKTEKSLHNWQQNEDESIELIEKFTDEDDLILDPFAGSGTVLSACKRTKRRVIGVEIEKENCNIIKARLSE